MARPSKQNARNKAAVLDALARGVALRDIERMLEGEVTKSTIQRWAKEHAPSVAARAKEIVDAVRDADASAGEDAELAFDPDASNLDKLRTLLDKTWQSAAMAEAAGNLTVASQMFRHAAQIGATIARIEKGQSANADKFETSRRDIDAAMARAMLRVKAIVSRPLLCAKCSRELSIEWGSER